MSRKNKCHICERLPSDGWVLEKDSKGNLVCVICSIDSLEPFGKCPVCSWEVLKLNNQLVLCPNCTEYTQQLTRFFICADCEAITPVKLVDMFTDEVLCVECSKKYSFNGYNGLKPGTKDIRDRFPTMFGNIQFWEECFVKRGTTE